MNKLPLPVRISDDALDYSLVYIPNLPANADPRYSVEPNTDRMHPIWRHSKIVDAKEMGKMVFSCIIMQQLALPGTTTPARQYLFFQFSKKPDPRFLDNTAPLNLQNMICYAIVPKNAVDDPIQRFVDLLLGTAAVDAKANAPKDTWASDLFEPPAPESGEDAENEGEGVSTGEVSHE